MHALMLLPINPISPKVTCFCWAASMEMVANYYNNTTLDIQCTLSRDLPPTGGSTGGCSAKVMPNDNVFRYYKLFKGIGISCSHRKNRKALPKIEIIVDLIDSGQPAIISGLHYPLLTSAMQHAFLVTGYYKGPSVNWILINDPIYETSLSKVAWVYHEITSFHWRINGRHNHKIDFISYFNLRSEKILSGFSVPDVSNGFEGSQTFDDLKNKIHTDVLTNTSLLAEFFSVPIENHLISKPVRYYSIAFEDFISNSFADSMFSVSRVSFCTVFVDNKAYVDIILYEPEIDTFHILGIRSSVNINFITEVVVRVGNQSVAFEFDRMTPNYQLLNIEPFNILFLSFVLGINNKNLYLPIENYRDILQKGVVYTQSEIIERLRTLELPENH